MRSHCPLGLENTQRTHVFYSLVHRSVTQRCLLLVGDLVAELDSEVDELVRDHLMKNLVAKVSDSKVVVRKAASQVFACAPI